MGGKTLVEGGIVIPTLLLKGNRKGPHAIGRKKQSIKPSLLYSMTTKYKYLFPLPLMLC